MQKIIYKKLKNNDTLRNDGNLVTNSIQVDISDWEMHNPIVCNKNNTNKI